MPFLERSLRVKNRMREIRSSGSVRGGDGDIPAYSAECKLNVTPLSEFGVRQRQSGDELWNSDRGRLCFGME
jgi:hypothetical protein